LWGFSLRRFKFIGVTEFFNADIDYVSNRVIGGALNAYRKRANSAKASSAYIISGSLRDRIEEYHGKDVALYNLALKLRERRLSV
jgi:ABC-type antimicrobial peptide transport system permease subunit